MRMVLAAVVAIMLAGCGGGGSEPCVQHVKGYDASGNALFTYTGDCNPDDMPAGMQSPDGHAFQFDIGNK